MGPDQPRSPGPPIEPVLILEREGTELAKSPDPAASRGTPWDRPRSARERTALWVAVGADVLQILVVPAFVEGWFSPANDILDVLVACTMLGLLGWHVAFLPTFVAEMAPVVGLFPTWTVAVLFVTRKRRRDGAPAPPVIPGRP